MKIQAQYLLTLDIQVLATPDGKIEDLFEIKIRGKTIPVPKTFFTEEEMKDLEKLVRQEVKQRK